LVDNKARIISFIKDQHGRTTKNVTLGV